jgi:hypothetical protein
MPQAELHAAESQEADRMPNLKLARVRPGVCG